MADVTQNTVIAADTRIKGEMSFKNTARIDGKFEGNIQAQGELQVGNSATCAADINADSLVCDGVVTGNVNAVQRVQLNGKAKMKGDIVSERLICAEGASLVGHVTVGPDARKGSVGQPADQKAPPPPKK
jgi:cytoskeletal protein CcmA (bactofilin family)